MFTGEATAGRVVSVLLGLTLLAAAGLKWWDEDPWSPVAFPLFASPLAQLGLIEVEAVLGLWLLFSGRSRLAWLAGLVFFTALAAGSLYLALHHVPSCGCFGKHLSINPWYTFGVDLVAIAALVAFSPKTSVADPSGVPKEALRTGFRFGIPAAVVFICCLFGLSLVYGSPWRALNRIRGEMLSVNPWWTDLGEVPTKAVAWFTVEVKNQEDVPVRLVGGASGCQCLDTSDLPIEIGPGSSAPVRLRVHAPSRPGRFQQWFRILAGDGQVAVAGFSGTTVEGPNPSWHTGVRPMLDKPVVTHSGGLK